MESPDITPRLPLLDDHRLFVAAPVPITWDSLTTWVARTHLGINGGFAHLVGTEPRAVTGTVPEKGSTFPGFAVTESSSGQHLVLTGRHRFAQYALVFVLGGHEDGTMLGARSYAVFPGIAGTVYRRLVLGSGIHRILVRRMIREIGRKAEHRHRG
ncbi:hypothetical protein [Streptomyces sp. cmx-4-9]|uniref:hypothetical protein n=1 Tax=Streptomyces sp. cmx-4-9 TaxID=2790941 RepID=UPI0039816909